MSKCLSTVEKISCCVVFVVAAFSFTEEITYLINGANQNALLLSKAKLEDETSFG